MTIASPVADIGSPRPPLDTIAGAPTWVAAAVPPGPAAAPAEPVRRATAPRRIRILMLAANPLSTSRLAIEEEARAIDQELRRARDRDTFELITCWAVRPADLLAHLNRYRPHIVHFSGHGARDGQLLLSAGDGRDQPVSAAALAELFRVMRDDVRVVLLNACYTAAQAQAISQHIDFVLGTRSAIEDAAAAVFAPAFYSALGFGRTIPQAFEQARTALIVHGLPVHNAPELLARPGADPHLVSRVWSDAGPQTPAEGATVNPYPFPPPQGSPAPSGSAPPSSVTASGSGAAAAAPGGIAIGSVGGGINVNLPAPPPPPPRRRMSFDTTMLLAMLVADVVFFLYGMWSYTGRNTTAEMWRAVIFLVMFSVTCGMTRRWFLRRM